MTEDKRTRSPEIQEILDQGDEDRGEVLVQEFEEKIIADADRMG